MTEELTNVIERAKQLCEWIGQNPHQRGSINGLAAQVQHELSALTQRPAAQTEREAMAEKFEAMHANGDVWISTVAAANLVRASLHAPQQAAPALTDSMGMPTSCGKPLCSPDEHHPLCSLHKPAAQDTQQATPEPVPMVLHCPKCGMQHIDAPEEHWNREFLYSWENPPHRSHLCHGCGTIWRPADVPTTGVKSISTKGKADTWEPGQAATPEPVGEPWGWAIEDKHGVAQAIRPARKEFFGCVQSTDPFTAEDIAKMDREWSGIAPHHVVTLYPRPAPGVPEGLIEYLRHVRETFANGPMANVPQVRGQIIALDVWIDALAAAQAKGAA